MHYAIMKYQIEQGVATWFLDTDEQGNYTCYSDLKEALEALALARSQGDGDAVLVVVLE